MTNDLFVGTYIPIMHTKILNMHHIKFKNNQYTTDNIIQTSKKRWLFYW